MTEPAKEFSDALSRLARLERNVALGDRFDEVSDALIQLRLAVIRAYPPRSRSQVHREGARTRILDYLVSHVGEWVSGEELSTVSGIQEWARRVRELRVEDGFDIEEDHGQYRLRSRDPDTVRRLRWRTVTGVKETAGDPEHKVAILLEALTGLPVLVDELDRVAGSKDGARLARTLRTDHGWPIETDADNSALAPGQYRLVTASPYHRLAADQGLFSEATRRAVFRRDDFRCWSCGGVANTYENASAEPFYLIVRHLDSAASGLAGLPALALTDLSRLATSCNRCCAAGA